MDWILPLVRVPMKDRNGNPLVDLNTGEPLYYRHDAVVLRNAMRIFDYDRAETKPTHTRDQRRTAIRLTDKIEEACVTDADVLEITPLEHTLLHEIVTSPAKHLRVTVPGQMGQPVEVLNSTLNNPFAERTIGALEDWFELGPQSQRGGQENEGARV